MKLRVFISLCLGYAVSSTTTAAVPTAYQLIKLSPLPGDLETRPTDINEAGLVLGSSLSAFQGTTVAWTNGQPSIAPLPAQAFGTALNGQGHLTGDLPQGGGGNHAFFWNGSVLQDIHSLGNKSVSTKINDAEEVVGWFQTSAIPQRGFRWKNDIMTDLGTFGGPESTAFGINQAGQVVGSAETPNLNDRAFIWTDLDHDSVSDPGEMVQLPDMGLSSAANGVNDSGVAVGFVLSGQFQRRGAIWTNSGGFNLTGQLLGATESEAFDINNHGEVVGQSGAPFLWKNGQMVNLNSLIPPNQGWNLLSAVAINDNGWIVGAGLFNRVPTGYLLKPIPEPSALAIFATAVVLSRSRRFSKTNRPSA